MGDVHDSSENDTVVVYEAEDAQGKTVKGKTSGVTESELRRRLEDRGYRVLSMRRITQAELEQEGSEAPAAGVVQVMIEQALRAQAEAIEISLREPEPGAGGGCAPVRHRMAGDTVVWDPPPPSQYRHVLVRYLVDGQWHDTMTIPTYVWRPLRDHLAGMAGLQPGEQPTPQTGSICFHFEGQDHDLKTVISETNIRIDTG